MLAADLPVSFPIPFANSAGAGFIRAIPQASQIGINNGAASLTDGFVPLNFQDVQAGGIPPSGQDFNGILYDATYAIQSLQAGYVAVYDTVFAQSIGGYFDGAILTSTSGTKQWQSTADNNLTNPDAGAASVTASISSTTMNVTAIGSGSLLKGQILSGIGVTGGTQIVSQLTGGVGGTGTYQVSSSQIVSSTTITATGSANWAVYAAGSYTFSTNGVQIWPSGLIFQWGNQAVPGSLSPTVASLNISYPNAQLQAFASFHGAASNPANCGVSPTDASTITLYNSAGGPLNVAWFSIGY